jgi:hypothetical protein
MILKLNPKKLPLEVEPKVKSELKRNTRCCVWQGCRVVDNKKNMGYSQSGLADLSFLINATILW